MRRVLLILMLLLTTVSANATECSKYLRKVYSDECNAKVKVVSKKEFIDKYEQEIDGEQVSAIAYGTGYIKYPKCKKQDILYVCLLREDCSIIWGEVIPQEK